LIVNNINDEIGLYRNNANANSIRIKLKGPAKNPIGIGADVYVKTTEITQFQELQLTRGYESSVSNILNFGLGTVTKIEEVVVQWPDGKVSKISNVPANKLLEIDYTSAKNDALALREYHSQKKNVDIAQLGIDYAHKENEFNDYDLQLLIPQKQSSKGTGLAKADVNGDGLEDFFVGNAAGASASLYLQNSSGGFLKSNEVLWNSEAKFEDTNALFFDADGDGDQDLYVVSAGYELSPNSALLQDRLYINDGAGNFSRSNKLPKMLTLEKVLPLPIMTKTVIWIYLLAGM
jgi:ASPIC and UnbV.